MNESIALGARWIAEADTLLVTAGAGMGVDSGLPDFRGNDGFWRAYPPYAKLGLGFSSLANPRWFDEDPTLAWGFYGHRLALYRTTVPHAGFDRLRALAAKKRDRAWVFTSNVDGQFQRAGFDRVFECHGSIHYVQCRLGTCGAAVSAEGIEVDVDPVSMRARGRLPVCHRCGTLARPAILMFGDGGWESSRFDAEEARLRAWLSSVDRKKLVVVECGAGTAGPTVRSFGERLAASGARLVRINVREPEGPEGVASIALGAKDALAQLDDAVRALDRERRQ